MAIPEIESHKRDKLKYKYPISTSVLTKEQTIRARGVALKNSQLELKILYVVSMKTMPV